VYTASVYPEIRSLGVAAIEQAIDFAAAIGAVHITVHPGLDQWPDVWPHMERRALDAQARSLIELSAYAASANIPIGIENMPTGTGAFQGYIDFSEIFPLLKTAPSLGVTLDVAHLHTAGLDPVRIIHRLGERITHVHVTDNKADFDSHSPIGEGTIQWHAVARALLEVGYCGVVELERSLDDGAVESSLAALREVFRECRSAAGGAWSGR
jgi:sugar phosphate isomerase/epimerase